VWSERYDRELIDVLALEDDIAQAIAARLRIEFAGGPRTPPAAVGNPDAYTAYLEGRHHFARGTPDALRHAMACYERATALDPGFALAYDSLAELHWYLGFFGHVPPREAFAVSTFNALRALELDDGLAQAHALLGMLRKELDYNWAEVDRECRRALQLNPESPLVRLRYAISGLMPHARNAEALAELDAIVRVDPLSIPSRWWLCVMALFAREYGRVAEEARHIIALASDHFTGHWALGMQQDAEGSAAEALVELEKAHALSGGVPFTLGFLAYAAGRAGRLDQARALLEGAREAARTSYIPPTTLAFAHIGLGEWDAAFERLDQAVEGRDPLVMPIKSYNFLDGVRGDGRYQALLRKMNLS